MRSCGNDPIGTSGLTRVVVALLLAATAVTLGAQSSDPGALFKQALRRETVLRQELEAVRGGAPGGLLLERIRVLVVSYEDLARLFPSSDQADDSLSQGGLLAADVFARFGEAGDRTTALRLLKSLATRFPSSSLARQASTRMKTLETTRPFATPPALSAAVAAPPSSAVTPAAAPAVPLPPATAAPPSASPPPPPSASASATSPVTLRAIRRELLTDALRITLELDREVAYYDERIEGPPRVFVDLPNTRAAEALKDATLPYPDGPVRQVRVGRQLNSRTRVVMDLNGAGAHSVYALYDPYRIVIDFERANEGATSVASDRNATVMAAPARAPVVMSSNASRSSRVSSQAAPTAQPPAPKVAESTAAGRSVAAPAPPRANANGGFSLARQLGLGISRIVIDPGHGGHDPGARVNGISEAALTLDVALRLEEKLKQYPEFEVVLTRRTNAYVPLEERTAMANRDDADLFLSVHANTSRVASVRGIETYFLNFATNPEAEAIAARENAGSAKHMRNLPDIVQAIAMNNKLDESRDFATIVQSTLYEQLRKTNRNLKNLGVKQAPFMVLVGATMPSVLAEISFMSNSAEAALLKTDRYKQQIADALFTGIVRYRGMLKKGAPRAE